MEVFLNKKKCWREFQKMIVLGDELLVNNIINKFRNNTAVHLGKFIDKSFRNVYILIKAGENVKKIREIFSAYISSGSTQSSLKYENQLIIFGTLPILGFIAVVNFAVFGFNKSIDLSSVLINSLTFFGVGVILYFTDKLIKAERIKSYLIILYICFIMIFIAFRYYQLIGPTVWTFTFVVILIAMIRNDKLMVTVVSGGLIMLGIHFWIKNYQVQMDAVYYLSQFIAYSIVFLVASGVQNINIERYKKLKHYLNESEMISQISSDLITVNIENLDKKINAMLAISGLYYGVDRSCIFLLSKDQQKLKYAYEWCAVGQEPAIDLVSDFDVNSTPTWVDQIKNKTVWIIPNVDELDIKQAPGKPELQALKIKSMISMPIVIRDKVYGILFYESFRNCLYWTDEHKKLLFVLTNMLADAFLKIESEKEMNYIAYYDALTGLPNRFHFNMRLEEAIEAARIHKTRIAVMFIDLDSFKSVNDTIGHEGGDELLRLVGMNLSEHLGKHGVVGRLGGDEFIILIPNISQEDDIEEITHHVMSVFNKPVIINNQEFFITASAGISVYPYDGFESVTLKKNADLAMYAAKELGKNQAAFCTPKMKDDIEKKVRITNLLHRALEKEEFILYYQPLVDVSTKEIIGVEALLRWMQPDLGMVLPSVFIPLAEQTGLINPIGEWVLKTACRQNKAWQDAGYKPIRMAVNLSIEQFRRADLALMIKEALDETGLAPEYLELEITESVAIKETDYICGILTAIRELGVSISIDDFGTEYSSLARIKRLPISRIKMAMEFVHGISISDKDEAIAKIIINLASNLGLKVIAEGVETEGQFEFLKNNVCDEVQGYYFHRPMPASDAEKILQRADTRLVSIPDLTAV